jgi:hypothetical protein
MDNLEYCYKKLDYVLTDFLPLLSIFAYVLVSLPTSGHIIF